MLRYFFAAFAFAALFTTAFLYVLGLSGDLELDNEFGSTHVKTVLLEPFRSEYLPDEKELKSPKQVRRSPYSSAKHAEENPRLLGSWLLSGKNMSDVPTFEQKFSLGHILVGDWDPLFDNLDATFHSREVVRLARIGPPLEVNSYPEPLNKPITKLVVTAMSPFPYYGRIPQTKTPFLNIKKGKRRGHRTRSGRVYWEDKTYNDRRALFHIPKKFDIHSPGVMIVFFHGHGAKLERDVLRRQRVPEQISRSGVNAVLVAPQFAVDARDSSAGKFWEEGGLRRFLDASAQQLSKQYGDPQSARIFSNMPVVIVAYSGGYLPAAWSLARGRSDDRLKGVVLLDALYGHVDKFSDWIRRERSSFFVSAYTGSTRANNLRLKNILSRRKLDVATSLKSQIRPGSVTFLSADTRHRDYVTRAWSKNPIQDLLIRLETIMTQKHQRVSGVSSSAGAYLR